MKNTTEHQLNPREIRRKLGLNQKEFWEKIGVTQSGGSRYESGRNMPRPVVILLRLCAEGVNLDDITSKRVKAGKWLEDVAPEMFERGACAP